MNKIYGLFHITTTDPKEFIKAVTEDIRKLQDDGQEAEVQYTTEMSDEGLCYTALIIGKKKHDIFSVLKGDTNNG